MYCENCGKKLEKGEAFCGNCGTKVSNVKPKKTVNDLMKNYRNLVYLGIVVVIVVLAFVFFGGQSEEVKLVKSWQNVFLEDENVTFGEVVDYAMTNVKWKDVTYEGKKAVRLSGVDKETGTKIVAILDPDKDADTIFLYYEEDGEEEYALDMAFYVTEYAEETAEHLGRE